MGDSMEMGQALHDLFTTNAEKFDEKLELLDTQERIQEFDQDNMQELHTFWENYAHRGQMMRKGTADSTDQTLSTIKVKPVTIEQLQEPKMGHKATKKREEGIKKSKKDKASISRYATDYTGYILEVDKAHVASKDDSWSGDGEDQGPVDAQAYKKEMLERKWNPQIFNKEFFANNFEYVRSEYYKLKSFIDENAPGTPAYDAMEQTEQARMRVLMGIERAMKDCYKKALASHSIESTQAGLVAKQTETVGADEDLTRAIAHMQDVVNESEEKVRDELSAGIQVEYEKASAKNITARAELQEAMKKDYPLVRGKFFSQLQYDNVNRFLVGLDLEKNLERVDQNREIIDRLLQDYVNTTEALCEYQMKSESWSAVQADFQKKHPGQISTLPPDLKMQANLIDNEYTKVYNLQNVYSKTLADMDMALNHLIYGKQDLNDSTYIILGSYGYKPAEDKYQEDVDAAGLYARTMDQKYDLLKEAIKRRFGDDPEMIARYSTGELGRCVMLMNSKDAAYNDKVLDIQIMRDMHSKLLSQKSDAQAKGEPFPEEKLSELAQLEKSMATSAETMLKAKLDAIIEYDLGDNTTFSNEQLIQMQPKIMEMVLPSMMMSDLAKIKSDVPPLLDDKGAVLIPAPTVQEKLLGKPAPALSVSNPTYYQHAMETYEAKAAILSAKRTILDGLRVQCRAAALLTQAATSIDDPLSLLTEIERDRKCAKYGDVSDADKLILFARDEMEKGRRTQITNEDVLVRNQKVRDWMLHDAVRKSQAPDLCFTHIDQVHDGNEFIHRAEEKIAARKKQMKDSGARDSDINDEAVIAKQLYFEAEASGDTATMNDLSILMKLRRTHFTIAGNDHSTIKEAIFRSFGSSESLSSMRKMSPEAYHEMLSDLSAGAFIDKYTPKEEVEAAREKNKKGLRTYYDNIKGHYEMLEDKYGYGLPEPSFLLMHYKEICLDLNNVQVDSGLVSKDRDVLDENNAEDQRFIHLVNYFNEFAGAVLYVMGGAFQMTNETSQFADMLKNPLYVNMKKQMEPDRDYLLKHPKGA